MNKDMEESALYAPGLNSTRKAQLCRTPPSRVGDPRLELAVPPLINSSFKKFTIGCVGGSVS